MPKLACANALVKSIGGIEKHNLEIVHGERRLRVTSIVMYRRKTNGHATTWKQTTSLKKATLIRLVYIGVWIKLSLFLWAPPFRMTGKMRRFVPECKGSCVWARVRCDFMALFSSLPSIFGQRQEGVAHKMRKQNTVSAILKYASHTTQQPHSQVANSCMA